MRIVDVVFAPRTRKKDSLGLALAVAIVVHAGVLVWAARAESSLESWAASVALAVHDDLAREDVVTIEPEKPPPKPIEEPPTPLSPPPAKSDTATTVDAKPEAPAAAPNVMASEAEGPVDLSNDTIVKGTATTPVSGAVAASGTRTSAATTTSPPVDRSRRVTLEGGEWACPWPKTAQGDVIDEQSVVIKVEVAADGRVLDAKVVKDAPGFGDAALACAKKTRFVPAADKDGTALRAWSPPIEVRFTR